jgi:2-methylcitrate dehydratase PrpD
MEEYTRDWEQQVVEFLAGPVPDERRRDGAAMVADVLAATVAGSAAPEVGDMTADAAFSDGAASILGTVQRTTVPQAVLSNVTAAITQEVEEGHNTGGHVGASIVAGGLPAAEASGIDGRTFVDACLKAYEVCVRMERPIFVMKARMNEALPWLVRNPHSTWTTVGPAVTSALCLGADEVELRETFRIAANLAVVSMHDPYAEGAPARNATAGFSAQVGASAAQTALAGLTGSRAAIEAVYDPFEDLLDEGFASEIATLGSNWEVTQRYHKPYPSCRYTHPPLDALRDAVDGEDVDPATVERVVVHTFRNATDMCHEDPETLTAAKFSAPYVLARYLTDGRVDLESFAPDAIASSDVRALAERVELVVDDEYEAAFPDSWGARVEVRLDDGRSLTGDCPYPRGDHRDPLSDADLRERNRRLLAHGLGEARADSALDALKNVSRNSVRDTVAALTPTGE